MQQRTNPSAEGKLNSGFALRQQLESPAKNHLRSTGGEIPSDEPLFTIKTTANMTDLNSHTIRAWERRYKALEPSRHGNGRRLYSQNDITRLILLCKLVKLGHSISSIASFSDDVLSSMLTTAQDPIAGKSGAKKGCELVLIHCLQALKHYDLQSIHNELEAARFLLSAREFVMDLSLPLMHQVGEMVAAEEMSIAQEHALSSVMRSILMQILYNVRSTVSARSYTRKDLAQGLVFAVAAPEGDLHEFGVLAASIMVATYGHNPHFFGANMPVKSLADAANAIKADVVLVGSTYIPDAVRVMTDEQYAVQLEAGLSPNTKTWWGGNIDVSLASPKRRLFSTMQDLEQHIAKLELFQRVPSALKAGALA
jgi:DNA-binding transcriptional MerR regulator